VSLTQFLNDTVSEPALPLLGVATLVVLPLAWWVGRCAVRAGRAIGRSVAKIDVADLLTYLAAGLATAVAAQGMWRFFGDVLQLPPALRLVMFGFIELAVVTSAVRARRSVRERGEGGVDAVAVWVLTSLSAVLSATDARSLAETVFRLAAPLVAAWLWERGMAVERRRRGDGRRIHWRVTPERIAVRCRLADPVDRAVPEIDAQRQLARVAVAAKRARDLRAAGAKPRRVQRALAALDQAMERAVTHADLATEARRQDQLLAQLAVLYNTASLLDVDADVRWVTRAAQAGDAQRVELSTEVSTEVSAEVSAEVSTEVSTDASAGVSIPVSAGASRRRSATSRTGFEVADAHGLSIEQLAGLPAEQLRGGEQLSGEQLSTRLAGRRRLSSEQRRDECAQAAAHPDAQPVEHPGEQGGLDSDSGRAPIPHAEAWRWFLNERRAGRDPLATEWTRVWGFKPSTARRYRKTSVDALRDWGTERGGLPTTGHTAVVPAAG
jgi:hypothetical protein